MMIELLNLLDPNQTLRDAIPKIIEVFVKYYGEEYREEITYKFQHLEMIGYGLANGYSNILAKFQEKISKTLIDDFLRDLGDENDHFRYLLFNNSELEFLNSIPFYHYIKYLEIFDSDRKDNYVKIQALNFLQRLDNRITLDNMDELIKRGTFSELERLIEPFNRMVSAYLEKTKVLEPFNLDRKKIDEHRKNLNAKYYLLLLDKYAHLFPKDLVQKIKNDPLSFNRNIILAYLGGNIESTPLLDAFSTKSNQILVDGEDWRKQSILRDRVYFFQSLGFDLGNNYDDYINNPEIQKLIPNQSLVEDILQYRMKLLEAFEKEFYETNSEFLRNTEIINRHQFMLKNNGYNHLAYDFKGAFVQPNAVMERGRPVVFPLILINLTYALYDGYIDTKLIHELNHVFELSLQSMDDKQIDFTCGWDIISCEKSKIENNPNEEKREYELFNEIINEMIAQEITSLMHQEGIYLFNTPENAKIEGGTSYERMRNLVSKFFTTFKTEILATRRNRDMQVLFDRVGEENFKALNDLIIEFTNKFSETEFLKMINEKQSGKRSPFVQDYENILLRGDEIFEKMCSYGKKK